MSFKQLIKVLFLFVFSVCFGLGRSHSTENQEFSGALSFEEFRDFAAELSKKVNLFEEAWRLDPKAEFFGGTTRDYLYWLRKQFQGVRSRADALQKMDELRRRSVIDARAFIIGESDIDLVSEKERTKFESLKVIFGIRKVDQVGPDRFKPDTPEGHNELHQGFIPTEKIRLGKEGFIDWPGLGDGLREIYDGRPTVHYASAAEFASTLYAKLDLNHPALLALRFVRILVVNHYHLYGRDFPDDKILFNIDPESEKETRRILAESIRDRRLKKFFENSKFRSWANGTIQKAFRAYTNPTAADRLIKHLGADALLAKFADKLEPTNQYLFAKVPLGEDAIFSRLSAFGFKPGDVFEKPQSRFSDLYFYHGVRSDDAAFRSILMQGTLFSQSGYGGAGLYGVALQNLDFAKSWATQGGDPERVVRLPIKPEARIVDITRGNGKKLFQKSGRDLDDFCDFFGIQILRYEYSDTEGFVVKDAAAVGNPEGIFKKIIPISEVLEKAEQIKNSREAIDLVLSSSKWGVTEGESKLLMTELIRPWFMDKAPEVRSLKEALNLLESRAISLLPASDRLSFYRAIQFETWLRKEGQNLSSQEAYDLYVNHPAFSLYSETIREEFKNQYVIPRLKELAQTLESPTGLVFFLEALQEGSFDEKERSEIVGSMTINGIHQDSAAIAIKKILSGNLHSIDPNVYPVAETELQYIPRMERLALILSILSYSGIRADPKWASEEEIAGLKQMATNLLQGILLGSPKEIESRKFLFMRMGMGLASVSMSDAKLKAAQFSMLEAMAKKNGKTRFYWRDAFREVNKRLDWPILVNWCVWSGFITYFQLPLKYLFAGYAVTYAIFPTMHLLVKYGESFQMARARSKVIAKAAKQYAMTANLSCSKAMLKLARW